MCGAPSQLLQVLHQTLPPAAYSLLMQRLASAREVPTVSFIIIAVVTLLLQTLDLCEFFKARIAQPGDAAGVVVDEDLE